MKTAGIHAFPAPSRGQHENGLTSAAADQLRWRLSLGLGRKEAVCGDSEIAMRLIRSMTFTKSVPLTHWGETARAKVIEFWEGRSFKFYETSTDVLKARRGSLWGNLVSYDMSRLRAELTAQWTGSGVECILVVDTRWQDVTEWNEQHWRLEMDTFESFLLHGDLKTTEWAAFRAGSEQAAREWTLTLMRGGRKMPPEK